MSIYDKLVSGYPNGDMGIVCLFFAVRGLVQYTKLPEKKPIDE